jgi:hypothetical protein
VDEIEEEEFIQKKFARDDEDPLPWAMEELAHAPLKSKAGFYPISKFSVFQNMAKNNETLHFPDFLYISRNHYNPSWTISRTYRRLKNVITIFEYEPSIKERPAPVSGGLVSSVAQFNATQEQLLIRCFNLFDTDEDGKLTVEDIQRVGH